jgi:hypothetical protein
MMKKFLAGVALVGVLGAFQAHADQQTNQAQPLATSGEPGTVQCYIMVPTQDGKHEKVIATMYGKSDPGGAIKDCAAHK